MESSLIPRHPKLIKQEWWVTVLQKTSTFTLERGNKTRRMGPPKSAPQTLSSWSSHREEKDITSTEGERGWPNHKLFTFLGLNNPEQQKLRA